MQINFSHPYPFHPLLTTISTDEIVIKDFVLYYLYFDDLHAISTDANWRMGAILLICIT